MKRIAAQGRYKIKLDDNGKKLAVKPANLLPLLQAGTYNMSSPCVLYATLGSLPTPLSYVVGSTALIHNLKAQQYNGLRCVVKKYDRSRHRYLVQLHRDGKQLRLKAENLR